MATMRKLTLAVLCTAVGGLLCGAPAQAAITREAIGSFGPQGPGAGAFEEPQSIAVEQGAGDVYVYDVGSKGGSKGSIYKFNAAGVPVDFSSSSSNVIKNAGGRAKESEIAVDSSIGPDAGDIYVATGEEVKIYAASGVQLGTLTTKEENREPCGVAVDPSGAVYVASYAEEAVKKYTPVTNPVGKEDETSTLYKVGKICNIAADSAGDVYAAGYAGKGGVIKYPASQFNTTGTAAAGTVFDSREGATLAVDPVRGNVYIDEQSNVAEYEASDELVETFDFALSKSFGVAVNHSSDEVYVANGKAVETFAAIVTPDVSTGGATSVTRTTATLNGSVNPDGFTGVLCEFEYGTTAGSFGHTVACEQAPVEGSAPVPVSASLTGLTVGNSYYYRLVAITENGKHYDGTEERFKTSPAVEGVQTAAASEVLNTSATLNGSLEPNGFDTDYFFEYGEHESFGFTTAREAAGELNEVKQISTPVAGLQPNKPYYFRLVAENGFGMTPASNEEEFRTPAAKPIIHALTTEVTSTTAGLIDTLNPENSETKYHFVYGTSEAYGQSTPEVALAPSFGEEAVDGGVIGELDPGTTLYYKLVATNQAGASEGPPQSVTTDLGETPPTVANYGEPAMFTTPGFPILLTAPSALPLIETPAIAFPAGSQESTGTTTETKKLTNAQKLTKALKACRKDRAKSRRASCEKQARKKYVVNTNAKGKKHAGGKKHG